mmetsp:Transcript_10229/g.32821  ORF Transcript_10229/g.32821 Transcript_10229/m.32821 type:complete len:114 (+) Transcript_10229:391-732(+)
MPPAGSPPRTTYSSKYRPAASQYYPGSSGRPTSEKAGASSMGHRPVRMAWRGATCGGERGGERASLEAGRRPSSARRRASSTTQTNNSYTHEGLDSRDGSRRLLRFSTDVRRS